MTTVYIVTEGEYSDYGIDSVFLNEENARAYAAMMDMDLEEWDADTEHECLRRGYSQWRVRIMKDGEVQSAYQTGVSTFRSDYQGFARERPCASDDRRGRLLLDCMMHAKSKDHAIKIANERRTGILAAHRWPDDPPKEE
jgi:hypothetical protein